MKQIITTGATGFIGSSFVEYLVKNNVNVLSLGRKAFCDLPKHTRTKLSGSTYLQIDMRNIHELVSQISSMSWRVQSDCVFFNLAWGGEHSLSDMNLDKQLDNVIYSVEALEVASKIGCEKFIQVGTMEEAFTEEYLNLDHNSNDEFNRHVIYSVAKIAAKRALFTKARLIDMHFNYILHSHVMGPHDTKDSFLQVTLQKLISSEELVFTSGEQLFDVISIEDCAEGYYLACLHGRPFEEYWVGSGDPRTLREYVERMYKLFPSGQKMQFGKLSYNDIKLKLEDFSILKLKLHTGFEPKATFEQMVKDLHRHLQSNQDRKSDG